MSKIRIELDREEDFKHQVYQYLRDLMDDDSLHFDIIQDD